VFSEFCISALVNKPMCDGGLAERFLQKDHARQFCASHHTLEHRQVTKSMKRVVANLKNTESCGLGPMCNIKRNLYLLTVSLG